uniref:Integrase core domain containing protein n=1 Tax=Solanum tuberosum TaxID=4113 RepID=M1D846_SOLTU
MTQLSTMMNPRQPGTFPSNTIQNPKNNGHCMEVTTRGGKQTIDPPMPSVVDIETRKDDDVVEVSGESENATQKDAEITQKVVPIPIPPPPFPQRSMKQSGELQSVSAITYRVESGSEVQIEERLGVEALAAVKMNFESDGIEEYDELVAALDRCEYRSKPKKLELDMKNRESPPARLSVEEAPKLELKDLPSHLRYVFLGRDETLTVIIAADLNGR